MTTKQESIARGSRGPQSLFAVALFAMAIGFPPVIGLAEASLTFHVFVQNLIVLASGYVFGRQMARRAGLGKPVASVLALAGVLIVTLWYVPFAWNFGHSDRGAYLLMHASSFLGAALVALSRTSFGEGFKWVLLVLYLDASGILMSYTMGGPMYRSHSADQHMTLSVYLMLSMVPAFLLVFLSPVYMPRVESFWVGRRAPDYVLSGRE